MWLRSVCCSHMGRCIGVVSAGTMREAAPWVPAATKDETYMLPEFDILMFYLKYFCQLLAAIINLIT